MTIQTKSSKNFSSKVQVDTQQSQLITHQTQLIIGLPKIIHFLAELLNAITLAP